MRVAAHPFTGERPDEDTIRRDYLGALRAGDRDGAWLLQQVCRGTPLWAVIEAVGVEHLREVAATET